MSEAGCSQFRGAGKLRADVAALMIPCAFGLIPIVGMILASYPVLLPPRSSVARMAFAVTGIVVAIYAVLRRRLARVTATAILGTAFLTLGLYPFANAILRRGLAIPEFDFATAYLAVCSACACFALWLSTNAQQALVDVLRIIAIVFALYSVGLVGWAYGVRQPYDRATADVVRQLSADLPLSRSAHRKPDVLHLVLDGMGRPDVLGGRFDMQLGPIVSEFRNLGFQIDPAIGRANYVQTHLSIPSMLNMTYLDALADLQRPTSNEEPLRTLILRARVPRTFKQLGYEVEFIGGGSLSDGEFDDADYCDCPQLWFFDSEIGALSLTPFKVLLWLGFGHRAHFERSLAVFDAFERDRSGSMPRYVFAHAMLPHPPFVVDEHGRFINPRRPLSGADASFYVGTPDDYTRSYRAQATFTLKRALAAATRVLENARSNHRDVIVIITGDHGPRLGFDANHPTAESGRFVLPVWLAIRWPTDLAPSEPPKSLVNIYRAVFERVFRMGLPPLPERAYVSRFGSPYSFIQVPD